MPGCGLHFLTMRVELPEKLLQGNALESCPSGHQRGLLVFLLLGAWEPCQKLAAVLAETTGTTHWGGPETYMRISPRSKKRGRKIQKQETRSIFVLQQPSSTLLGQHLIRYQQMEEQCLHGPPSMTKQSTGGWVGTERQ